MGLPWVRLDSNIASHDKILTVLEQKNGHKAAWMYVCGLGYSAGHGTDGLIPFTALPFIHGTKELARTLVAAGLWAPDPEGWRMHNWAARQEIAVATQARRAAQSSAAARTNCIRWHGAECGCWQPGGVA